MNIQEIIYGGKVHTGSYSISNQIYGFHDDDDDVVVVYLHSHFPKKHRKSCSSKILETCHDTPQVILAHLLILLVCCMWMFMKEIDTGLFDYYVQQSDWRLY